MRPMTPLDRLIAYAVLLLICAVAIGAWFLIGWLFVTITHAAPPHTLRAAWQPGAVVTWQQSADLPIGALFRCRQGPCVLVDIYPKAGAQSFTDPGWRNGDVYMLRLYHDTQSPAEAQETAALWVTLLPRMTR